jgi:serine/threonine protein kinase
MPTNYFDTYFPDYEVIAELDQGDERVVKAKHQPSGDLVIIKQCDCTVDANTRLKLEHEAQVITQIDHPNIVRVREMKFDADICYRITNFVEGDNLRSLIGENGFLDVSTTIRLGLQLTGAFRALHSRHIIHSTINPETILYRKLDSGELHALLTDIGGTDYRTNDSLVAPLSPTYKYVAPEQFTNGQEVSEAADYYALGVVLYECLTGQVPFALQKETEPEQFIEQVLTAPMPVFSTASGEPLPSSLVTLLMALLVRNPQDRLQNVAQLELQLKQSQVEQLNTAWSATKRPTNGNVAKEATAGVNGQGENEILPDSRARPVAKGIRRWWLEIIVVSATVLVIGSYFRTVHHSTDEPVIDKASVIREVPTPKKNSAKSEAGIPLGNGEENANSVVSEMEEVNDTVNQRSIKPTGEPNSLPDSAARSQVLTDSTVVIPPDTAR